eukprot:gene2557-3462_t
MHVNLVELASLLSDRRWTSSCQIGPVDCRIETYRVGTHMEAPISRRRFLSTTAATGVGVLAMPYLSRAADRPVIGHGVQSGDVGVDSGMVWSRADRASQMMVEVSTTESFKNLRALPPVNALPESDFTAKLLLEGLPPGQDIFYRISFHDIADSNLSGDTQVGHFKTAPAVRQSISFVWSGDTVGQGWGIDVARGGLCATTDFSPVGVGAARRRDLAQHRDGRKIRGGAQPGVIPSRCC